LFKIREETKLFLERGLFWIEYNKCIMSRGKLNWKNLLTNDCPKCGCELDRSDIGAKCSSCNFFASGDKIEELKDKFGREDRAKSDEFEGYGENFGMD